VLSSFFWGYVLTQVPAGQLAQKYGPKIILLCAMFICSLLNLLTPLAASLGDWQVSYLILDIINNKIIKFSYK